jgi:hypothetical protein
MQHEHYIDLWQFLMFHWNWVSLAVAAMIIGIGLKWGSN